MKLTSTLLAAAVAAGLCSTAANAGTLVYDTFETDQTWTKTVEGETTTLSATDGMAIKDFRRTYVQVSGNPTVDTNEYWQASDDDASKIKEESVTWATATSAATVPGTNSLAGAGTSALYLALDTEGYTLSRTFGEQTLSASSVFVDTMVQFTASDEATGLDNSMHIALWLNESGNLMLWGRVREYDDGLADYLPSVEPTNVVIATGITTGSWHRVTIESKQPSVNSDAMFCVYLDGAREPLTNDDYAFTDAELGGTNTTLRCWFVSAKPEGTASTLSEVAFQGTGAIDNLTVATDEPDFLVVAPVGATLTLSWDTGIASVTQDGNALTSGDTIASGDTITVTASDWYTTSIAGDGVTVTPSEGFTTNGYGIANTIVTATLTASADAEVTITAAPYAAAAGALPNGTDADKAAAWAIAKGKNLVTLRNFAEAYYDQYLLNADADADVDFAITDIETTSSNAVIKVQATANGDPITNAFNGTVYYWAAGSIADLTNAVDHAVEIELNPEDGYKGTITVPVEEGQFIKAWVK